MGSATSADAKKQQKREEKIQQKLEKALMQKERKREKLLENHEDFDEDGKPFFYDDYGKKYYLDDDLIPYYLDENKHPYHFDRNGHKFYLDKKGRPYHVDEYGERCQWDNKGNPCYINEAGDIFYRDYDRQIYYLDNEGMPFYIDDLNKKIWIRLDCLDENGRVISRTKSRKAIKDAKLAQEKVKDESDKASALEKVEEEEEEEISRISKSSLSRSSTLGHEQTSCKSKDQASVESWPLKSPVSNDTSNTTSSQTAGSAATQMTDSTLREMEFALPRFRTLTPEYDKYPDIPPDEDRSLEDIAKSQLESDRRILKKILAAEKEKGILPPKKVFRKIGNYTVKEKNDKKDCSITGSAFLPNGNLVVSDFHNRNLKMYDPDLKFLTDLKLDAYPENMCARAQDFDIYVPFKTGIQYGIKVVKVNEDTMTLMRTIQTKGLCYGICSNNGGLAVIVNTVHGWQVHLLDLKGVPKKQLTMEIDDKPLLKRPDYLAVTRDLRLLISDRGANSVFCFDIWSEEVFFEYKAIREPYGVSCDNKGSIFVTSPGGVHQISTSGERIAALMKREEIGFSPTCACYDTDDSLLVLTGQSNNMVAFQLMDALSQDFDQKTKPKRKS